MPISCPIQFASLSTEEMRDFDRPVLRCAFDVQNDLGRLCDEFIYKNSFRQRLRQAGLEVVTEVPVKLAFNRYVKTLFIDAVVNDRVPYELKAVRQLTTEHETQLLIYMLLVRATRGKLINFRPDRVESRFVNAYIDWAERHRFEIGKTNCSGDSEFSLLVELLIHDWGTCLSSSLYTQAIVANLGGEDIVVRHLPISLDGEYVGNQKFRLLAPGIAFEITTFNRDDLSKQEIHLKKLLATTQLAAIQWVNIARHEIAFKTIQL